MADTQNTQVLNNDGTLNEDFKAQLTALANDLMAKEEVQYSNVVKEYVEGQTSALENKLLNNAKWTEVKANIDAILAVFDENKDGSLKPEEILSKFGEIKAKTDANTASIAAVSDKLESNVKDLTANISAVSTKVDGVKASLTDLETKFNKQVGDVNAAAAEAVSAVKTELGGKVDAVEGKVSQIDISVANVDAKVGGTVDAIKGIAEAFQAAAKEIDSRMNDVRNVFGLKVQAPAADAQGDGAVV